MPLAVGRQLSSALGAVDLQLCLSGTWLFSLEVSLARYIFVLFPREKALLIVISHMPIRAAAGAYGGESSAVVDLFNCLTQTWSTAHLSVARMDPVAASVGSIALFAGGQSRKPFDSGNPYISSYYDSSVVDVFHVTTAKWSNASLSVARKYLSATTVGDLAVFAGGENSDVVDSYRLAVTGGSTYASAAAAV